MNRCPHLVKIDCGCQVERATCALSKGSEGVVFKEDCLACLSA